MTDGDGKKNVVDDEDVTRPATPSAALGGVAAGESQASRSDRVAADARVPDVPAGRAVLRRLAPEDGAGESIVLETDGNLLGRSHTCNVPLLSATASRQHAEIVARNGEWFLSPAGGKTVIVDGRPVYDEVPLRHEMRIRLGKDELLFLREGDVPVGAMEEDETYVVRSEGGGPPPARAAAPRRTSVFWFGAVGAAGMVAALAFWLLL